MKYTELKNSVNLSFNREFYNELIKNGYSRIEALKAIKSGVQNANISYDENEKIIFATYNGKTLEFYIGDDLGDDGVPPENAPYDNAADWYYNVNHEIQNQLNTKWPEDVVEEIVELYQNIVQENVDEYSDTWDEDDDDFDDE